METGRRRSNLIPEKKDQSLSYGVEIKLMGKKKKKKVFKRNKNSSSKDQSVPEKPFKLGFDLAVDVNSLGLQFCSLKMISGC